MMKRLYIQGAIIDDEDALVYDFLEQVYTSPQKVKDFLETVGETDEIEVYINSGGGSVFAGSEIYTLLTQAKNKVNVIVSGLAGSIASIIAMSGDTIAMSKTAQMMIHNATLIANGDYRDMEKASEMLEQTSESLATVYAGRLKEGYDIRQLLDDETWITATKAVEMGLADSILQSETEAVEDTPQLVASSTSVIPKAKIKEFKALYNQSNKIDKLAIKEAVENVLSDFKDDLKRELADSQSKTETVAKTSNKLKLFKF